MKKSLKLIPWIPVIRMILPLYAGWLDCCCKVQVKSYMYSNIGRNPNVLLMLTSFKFACKLKFGYRLVSCELCVCFSLVWSIGACNAFLLFPTTHLHGGGICSNIVWSNEGTGFVKEFIFWSGFCSTKELGGKLNGTVNIHTHIHTNIESGLKYLYTLLVASWNLASISLKGYEEEVLYAELRNLLLWHVTVIVWILGMKVLVLDVAWRFDI